MGIDQHRFWWINCVFPKIWRNSGNNQVKLDLVNFRIHPEFRMIKLCKSMEYLGILEDPRLLRVEDPPRILWDPWIFSNWIHTNAFQNFLQYSNDKVITLRPRLSHQSRVSGLKVAWKKIWKLISSNKVILSEFSPLWEFLHEVPTFLQSNLDLRTPLNTYFWLSYFKKKTYYTKYVLEFNICTLLEALEFNIRTLLNILKFNVHSLSTLSKVRILNSSTFSKVRISNLSTYLE